MPGNSRITNQISGTSKMVSGTQNLERNVPNTTHKNVPDISLLLGTLFLLAFPVKGSVNCGRNSSNIWLQVLKLLDVPMIMKRKNASSSLRILLQMKLGRTFHLVRKVQIACGIFWENSTIARFQSLSNTLLFQCLKVALSKVHPPHSIYPPCQSL